MQYMILFFLTFVFAPTLLANETPFKRDPIKKVILKPSPVKKVRTSRRRRPIIKLSEHEKRTFTKRKVVRDVASEKIDTSTVDLEKLEKKEEQKEKKKQTPDLSRSRPVDRPENQNEMRSREQVFGSLKSHSLGVGLGQSYLVGDFADNGENKIVFDILYSYKVSYSFDFYADLHYSKHQKDRSEVSLPGLALAIKSRWMNFDAFSPFVLGGFGFYRPTVSNGQGESVAKTVFGFNIGAGADLKLSERVAIGGIVHYHNPFDVPQESSSALEGSYYKLLMTLQYSF